MTHPTPEAIWGQAVGHFCGRRKSPTMQQKIRAAELLNEAVRLGTERTVFWGDLTEDIYLTTPFGELEVPVPVTIGNDSDGITTATIMPFMIGQQIFTRGMLVAMVGAKAIQVIEDDIAVRCDERRDPWDDDAYDTRKEDAE